MLDDLKTFVLGLLRVPPAPAIPAGGEAPLVFRAAPNYYRYRFALWALKQLAALFGLVFGTVAIAVALRNVTQPWLAILLQGVEAVAWLTYLAQLPLSYAILRLDFELRWYVLSDRSLRIREGILSLREKTMTFANIQHIEIRQNPLQRLLRIADVQVRTAGGGGGKSESKQGGIGESGHEASFRGVDNAVQVRNLIADRVKRHRDSGLGDPEDGEHAHPGARGSALLEAGRAVAREAHLLRSSLTG